MGKGGFTHDFTQTADAGRSAYPQLFSVDRAMLCPLGRGVRQTFQKVARTSWPGRDPKVAAIPARREETQALFLHSGRLRPAVFLPQYPEPQDRHRPDSVAPI